VPSSAPTAASTQHCAAPQLRCRASLRPKAGMAVACWKNARHTARVNNRTNDLYVRTLARARCLASLGALGLVGVQADTVVHFFADGCAKLGRAIVRNARSRPAPTCRLRWGPCRRSPTDIPTEYPTLVPSSPGELRSSVPTLAPTRAVLFLDVRVPLESPVRVDEGGTTLVLLSARAQGKLLDRTVTIRCTSSNSTLLHVGCPDQPSAASPGTCEMPLHLAAGNLSVLLIAADDFDNRGHPPVKSASVLCSGSSGSALDVRPASLDFEITNVIRPIIGAASFTPSRENATREILRSGVGTLEVVTSKEGELKLQAHPAFTSPSFVHPTAALVSAVDGQRLPLYVNKVDATSLSLQLPSFEAACGNRSACVFGLEIRNTDPDAEFGRAGVFECPRRLPTGKLDFRCFGAIDATRSPPDLGNGSPQYHVVRYVETCTAADELYEDPGSAACFDSIESAQKCAFGLRDTCKRCPYGAICPGGNEARSFPGFFTLSSHKGIVEQCPPPEIERCTGWNAQTLATRCGKAYSGALISVV